MRGECENPRDNCWQPEGPYSDEHHLRYPAALYSGWLACKYRNLPENKQQICRCDHDLIHETEEPPEKPSRKVMAAVIKAAFKRGETGLSKKQRGILDV